ncbi:unnamed protein product [Musa acuminata subsp. malaccensis]|uniref:(wild Malaysian banana) hypothetical protein n=1 Tax=Musa acuminata subsp. malaccensis TaxID=214687 RepID=A0A804I841_MUSAM|nr:unnamed protein product [Musa acuminata subsp. malaccensis]
MADQVNYPTVVQKVTSQFHLRSQFSQDLQARNYNFCSLLDVPAVTTVWRKGLHALLSISLWVVFLLRFQRLLLHPLNV